MKAIWDGFMWVTGKLAVPLTVGGTLLLPFVGAIMDRVKLLNPDAGVVDLVSGWFSPLTTDPNSVFAVNPMDIVDPDSLSVGVEGVVAGLGSSFSGWGHFFTAAWDAAAPLIDVATGGGGTLVSAFTSACGGTIEDDLNIECLLES